MARIQQFRAQTTTLKAQRRSVCVRAPLLDRFCSQVYGLKEMLATPFTIVTTQLPKVNVPE